jgi:hypothetical protein
MFLAFISFNDGQRVRFRLFSFFRQWDRFVPALQIFRHGRWTVLDRFALLLLEISVVNNPDNQKDDDEKQQIIKHRPGLVDDGNDQSEQSKCYERNKQSELFFHRVITLPLAIFGPICSGKLFMIILHHFLGKNYSFNRLMIFFRLIIPFPCFK